MGNIAKIPYLKEVGVYLIKFVIIFFLFREILSNFNFLNRQLLEILALFLAFPMKLLFLMLFIAAYFIFFLIAKGISSEFILLFIYLLNTLVNTFLIMIYVKYVTLKK